MRIARQIDFEGLELSSVFTAWLDRRADLDAFLPRRPCAMSDVASAFERGAGRSMEHRELVCRAIVESLGPDLHDAQREALEQLRDPETVAIVTGQQPCLFGGPLYVAHKVATALRLARDLRAELEDRRVVTVFWNHDEDHDWGEANHVAFVNPALDIQRVRLRLPSTGRALGSLSVGEALDRAVDEARDLIIQTPHGLEELESFRPRSDEETVAHSTTRMLQRHFGEAGLLILEPTRLDDATRHVVRDWHERAEELRTGTKMHAAALVDRGYDVTVDPEQAFVFAIDATGRRRAVPDGEELPLDVRPSPGVLLRSVWQDSLLPTLAYVAGPGEVSYLALAASLYERLGVARPLLLPRASIVHAEPRTLALLEKFELAVPELRRGATDIERLITQRVGDEEDAVQGGGDVPGCEDRVRELAVEFRRSLRDLEADVTKIDPHLVHPLHKIASKSASELERFADKLHRQRKNRAGRFRQHARRLCAELFPRGHSQERVLPLLPFVARGGPRFAMDLLDVADPFADRPILTEYEACT